MKFDNISLGDHPVEEWEFYFLDGSTRGLTVDALQGDTHDFPPVGKMAVFKMAEKPSPVDPEGISEAEDVFIPMRNLVRAHKFYRIKREIPIEQKEIWQTYLKEMVNDRKFGN